MKKVLVMLLALAMVLSFAACAKDETPDTPDDKTPVTDKVTDGEENKDGENNEDAGTEDTVKVMTYAEYMAAAIDADVVIEAYVQATQSWWFDSDAGFGKITVYAQDADGAYFIYEMKCEEADAAKLIPGTKIRVSGVKAEWSGEVEINTGSTFEIIEGAEPFIAEPKDVTAALGTDELIKDMNKLVAFKGMTVKSISFKESEWDPDIYVTLTYGENEYSFCVENYLCGPDTDVYKAVAALKAGDKIDCEGFLYWYNGANTHITSVTVVAE